MRSRPQPKLVLKRVVVVSLVVLSVGVVPAFAGTTTVNSATKKLAHALFPHSSVSIIPKPAGAAGRPGDEIIVKLPAKTRSPTGTQLEREFDYNAMHWRLFLFVPLAVHHQSGLTRYKLEYPHNDQGVSTMVQVNDLSGFVERHDGEKYLTKLDSIDYALAKRQVRASMKVLSLALGKGNLKNYRVSKLAISKKRFAVTVHLSISRTGVLKGHLADVFLGLATGLTGGDDSMIEGLQIVVTAHGKPALGAWNTERYDTGILAFNRSIRVPKYMKTTVRFPDLTGGPHVTESVRD